MTKYAIYEDDSFSMLEYLEKSTQCGLLFLENGIHLSMLDMLASHQNMGIIIDGYPLANLGKAEIINEKETKTHGHVIWAVYIREIERENISDFFIKVDVAILYPIFSISMDGALKSLQHVARMAPGKKLYIYNYGRIPMRHCAVIDKYKLIFMPIPKCGSTSTLTVLLKIIGLIEVGDVHNDCGINSFYRSINVLDQKFAGYFKFSILSNPYARLSSLYKSTLGSEYIPYQLERYKNIDQTFANFCDFATHVPDVISEIHCKSQLSFVFDLNSHSLVDYVGNIESIHDVFLKNSKEIGIDIPIEHLNRSNSGTRCSSFYTDSACKKAVQKRYSDDFELAIRSIFNFSKIFTQRFPITARFGTKPPSRIDRSESCRQARALSVVSHLSLIHEDTYG